MKSLSNRAYGMALCAVLATTGLGSTRLVNADETTSQLRDRSIGYVTTDLHWSVYQTPNLSVDCPDGLNGNGPRETFKALFPQGGPVETTQLAREGLKVFPQDKQAQFPYILAKGPVAIGLNLDGKVGPNDFVSPTGETGINNQFFRVIGCNAQFRSPDGQLQLFANKLIRSFGFDRIMIEITQVDSLVNADNVEVTIYRGRDPLLLDATGEKVAPGGSQRVDMHYGKQLIQHMHGRIANGVLTTDPIEGVWPWAIYFDVPTVLHIHDMRLNLKLSSTSADGLIAGYTDVDSYYHWLTSWSTHHLAYGRLDPSEFYWALRQNADAYPDKDGAMTAISSAITVNMTQVFIEHTDANPAEPVQRTADAAH
ncbi:MAG: hypothetical protein JWN85_3954 [Gammaproteobacteria bacterium]|nr:hypothetical protein [Gammaproteobacteria bacterium]